MSDYTKGTNFATKDTLPSGNSGKIVKGTEIDTEFNAIASAITSKADKASPTFTGTPSAPTATTGSNTTQLANTAYVKNAIDDLGVGTLSTQDANAVSITGGSITGITDLAVADGGTGASTLTGVVIGNGTSAMTAVAPSTSGNVLTSNGSSWTSSSLPAPAQVFGSTWTNLTGTKTSFNTYTNTTGKYIQVFCNSGCNGGGNGQIYINGNLVARWAAQFNGCGGYSCNMAAIVPPGATYYITSDGAVNSWWELI